jgi:hypothetical protein
MRPLSPPLPLPASPTLNTLHTSIRPNLVAPGHISPPFSPMRLALASLACLLPPLLHACTQVDVVVRALHTPAPCTPPALLPGFILCTHALWWAWCSLKLL